MQVVVESLEQTFAQVHVANGVDTLRELNGARNLTVAVGPMVLNSFHVPLVDENDNLVTLSLIDFCEQILVSLIDQDLLDLGEEDVS